MGSQVTRVIGLLPANFQRPTLFLLDLGSGTGQTDRRTDNSHQFIMPPPYGGGHNKSKSCI